jgi:hypothetical protein
MSFWMRLEQCVLIMFYVSSACNGHGKCTSYDMCICSRNWQAADCSERVCQFGLAHVDTPKGDLDGSGALTGPDHVVVENNYVYPYGTTEQFPQMEDTDLNKLDNSAHYYMECSNKGTCDRSTGECNCFDGYDGVACQRASCPGFPNSCSGHGVCKSKRQLAWADNQNVYKLWDKDATMGCECDAGYQGADCSERQCKFGIDPLYLDDSATVKFPTWDFGVFTTGTGLADFTNGENGLGGSYGTGHWAIRFYDNFGEDWLTAPIKAGATCSEVIQALEDLPNNVVPSGLTQCVVTTHSTNTAKNWFTNVAETTAKYNKGYSIYYNLSIWEALTSPLEGDNSIWYSYQKMAGSGDHSSANQGLSGYIYRLRFFGNPGAMKQPAIDIHLDGKRPSLLSKTSGKKIITKVWTDGQQGEYDDHFADHCDGVTVTIDHYGQRTLGYGAHSFGGLTVGEIALLKKCLGPSDFDTDNNVEVYNWDYGSRYYPHIVKLVRTTTTYVDGGYYVALFYDSSVSPNGLFRLVNPFVPPDAFMTDMYEVYTTKGTLALTSNMSQAVFSFASNTVYMVNSTYDTLSKNYFDGDVSCEVGDNNAYKFQYIHHCLNKTDLFTMLSWTAMAWNPPNINLYKATRLFTQPYQLLVGQRTAATSPALVLSYNTNNQYHESHYGVHMISTDIATNWGATTEYDNDLAQRPVYGIYKFFPATSSTYNYVNECSNRGLCQRDTGLCSCFPGYTNDDCSVQNSLSL